MSSSALRGPTRWVRIVALGLASMCLSASIATATQTLQQTLTQTYQTNPDLAAERAHVREVDEGVSQANARWRPSITLEAEVEQTSGDVRTGFGKFDTRSQNWTAEIVASQPLFTAGRNGIVKDLALARVKSARARLRIVEQKVLLDAVVAHVDAARNEMVLDLVRGDITLLQALHKEATERRDAKISTDSDVDQTLAALEAARAECLSRLATLNDSWRAYEQIVGSPPPLTSSPTEATQVNPCVDAKGDRLRSTVSLPVDLAPAPATLHDVEKAAQESVPELDEARAEEEASHAGVSAAYAELLPHASLNASIGLSGEEFDPTEREREAAVSAELTIPIFNTGAEWSEIRAAREANNRARLNIVSRQRQVMRDALHAWYDLVSIRAVRSVNKVQVETLLRAFEGLRKEIADPKLKRSVTDLLALRLAHLGAEIQLLNSQHDEAITIFRLMAATGNLNAAFLNLPVDRYDPAANLREQADKIIGDEIQGEK